jgi:DNA modification methylase
MTVYTFNDIRMFNGDFLDVSQNLPCAVYDLVIADPPYFKVVNEKWDHKWKDMNDYLLWTKNWLEVVYKQLRYGGTLYLFGYFRSLAHVVKIAEDLGFELRQQIIINKGIKSVAGRKTSTYKIFPNVTESVLFFIKDNKQVIKPLLKHRAEELGLTPKEINSRLGVKANGGGMWSIYTGKNVCEQFPTKEAWNKLMSALEMNLPYEKYAQTFNKSVSQITDVWSDINFYFDGRIHPTQKPYELIERLILSSTNVGDLVLDPFSGSGITGVVANATGRRADLVELDANYFELSKHKITLRSSSSFDTIQTTDL